MNQSGGCSPLITVFQNTTTGASSSVTYEWDFGSGNTSTLTNPSGVFIEEKVYSVMLTVIDGNQTSVKTKEVTVYKKPIIDFAANLEKGCTPFPVTFTANASADNGNIVNYLWDFGDGFTSSERSNRTNHTYTTPQKPSVTLSLTDDHGCTSIKVLNEIIEVFPGIKANFKANKTFLCAESDPVQMLDQSISDKSLTYLWNFGDGITSTEKDPIHSFNTKGSFSVKLAIKNTDGCTNEITKSSYLNVANFKSEINIPDVICQNSRIELRNTSTPTPSSFTWTVNGIPVSRDYDGRYGYYFYQPGKYTVSLKNKFGDCEETVEKIVTINELIQPKGFIIDIPKYCSFPVTVSFKDTTPGQVTSEWSFNSYNQEIQASGKSVSYSYGGGGNVVTTLFLTDEYGCKTSVQKYVNLPVPYVYVQAMDNNSYAGCGSLKKQFKFISNTEISSFEWNFGDGATSTEKEPEHTFGLGVFNVTVRYTTANGCTGVTQNSYTVVVKEKPKADFESVSGTTICGNSFVKFKKSGNDKNLQSYWLVNEQYPGNNIVYDNSIQFQDTGLYTISLIVYNEGCGDTMTRKDYIHVIPSIPKINAATNTCDNDRGTVTFTQLSKYAEKWKWDFGDGTSKSYDEDNYSITHQYTNTGRYMAVLTTTNGQCSNKDSIEVRVLLKQQPVITSEKTIFCAEEPVSYRVTGLVRNPAQYSPEYIIRHYSYADGTIDNSLGYSYDHYIYSVPFNVSTNIIDKTKDQFRIIVQSMMFNCMDTSNFIPIKLKGAKAAFEIINNNECFGSKISFRDTSSESNTNITSRQWDFGDGQTLTTATGGIIKHTYPEPGQYNVTLRITDASGCTSAASSTYNQVYINGPKAAFSAPAEVHLNTNVYFTNRTNYFNSYNTTYDWDFGDGSKSNSFSPNHTYTQPGTYIIRMIAKGETTGCIDTAYQTIIVKNFNANFSINTSYLNSAECNSLLARFRNTSLNYTSVKWDFGDGSFSDNNNTPTHIYSAPGKYIVKLHVTGHNGLSETFIDSVVIEKYDVNIKSDLSRTCTSQGVIFSADTDVPSTYLWDFGDGNIIQVSDTFYKHAYKSPGVYNPQIIVSKANGCVSTAVMKETIIIDSLFVSLNNLPDKICAPKEIHFDPEIILTTGDKSSLPLSYQWNFGTGNQQDISDKKAPVFEYLVPGNYTVSLKVQSHYGCVKESQASFIANQGLGATMNGPSEICEQSAATFTGGTKIPGAPQWKWIFEDGTTSNQQNPPERKYNIPGDYSIRFIVDNKGCTDTISHTLTVNPKPVVVLSETSATICEGSSISISASGGTIYNWFPSEGLNPIFGATINAHPLKDIFYTVNVTDDNGCSQKDSVKISVVHPFKLNLKKEAAVCFGESIQLTSMGGDQFQWINNTVGLSNTDVQNPTAAPVTNSTYTLAATDKYHCFSDTANIHVTVHSLPAVNAGTGKLILSGSSIELQATGSSDITDWKWTPAQYLDCSHCSATTATPRESTIYTIAAKNIFGCTSTDTISIKLFCNASSIFIPNAFSPNDDGLNDYFSILGQGISQVSLFRIYDRWGTVIFERYNFRPDDKNARWDGRYKGEKSPEGVYTYMVEMSCKGETFLQKGTVTLMR